MRKYISALKEKNNYSQTFTKSLSIIVPVYNVEAYLKECLDPLLNLNIDNYEVIVVNDGSQDSSQEIIDTYHDKKLISLIKENGGLASARNYGLNYARGKYLCFVDSDDIINPSFYEEAINLLENDEADLLLGDLKYFYPESDKEDRVESALKGWADEINKDLLLSPLFSWNKIYRHELFKKLECEYPEGLWYEDIPVTLKYFVNSHSILYLDKVMVNYRQRSSSILGSSYSEKMNDIFTIFDNVLNYFKENNLFETYYSELEYLLIEHFLLYGAFRFLKTDHYQELMPKAFEYVKNNFPKWKKNKYLKNLPKKYQLFLLSDNKVSMNLWHRYLYE